MNTVKLFLLLLLFLTLHANAEKHDAITLQLQWKHQFEFAGFYAAKEKGFYKDVGLDVSFVEYNKNKNIVNEVLQDNAQYGLSYSSIVADYLNGKPIILLANFFKQSPLVLVAQENIKQPSDLKGKKIMGVSNSIDNITLLMMLNKFDISLNDITTIPASFKIDAFINKDVDAMSAFTTNELYYLNQKGIKYNIFDPTVYGAKYYDVNLFTSEDELKNHPKRVKDFTQASIKGWEYALKHQDEIIDLILKKYNSQKKSRDALQFEAKQIEQIMLPNVYEMGSIDTARVKSIADSFIQSGFIQNKNSPNITDFIYDSLKLSISEIAFLKNRKSLHLCVDPNWMPFEAMSGGTYQGMNADFLKIIQKNIPIPINIYPTQSWSDSLKAFKQKKCDILSLVMPTEERKTYLNFTQPYINAPLIIVATPDKKNIIDISLLDHAKIAVVRDYALIDIIKKHYPNLTVVEVNDIREGLQKVQDGTVLGFAGSSVTIDYYFQNTSYSDFKTIAYFDEKLSLSLGMHNDDLILSNILEKIVGQISLKEKESIIKQWFPIKYENNVDYNLLWKLLIAVSLLSLFFIYRQYILKRANVTLKKKLEKEFEASRDKDKIIFQQNKLAAMGEMIENIAHQWRQPLSQINSAILVLDGLLRQKNIHDEAIETKLLEIESLTQYMSHTIYDFKDFFSQDKKKEHFNVDDIINNSISIIRSALEYENIELRLHVKENITLFGYPRELQQVILVILNNAKDAHIVHQTLQPYISISTLQDKASINIEICDNAGGIDKESITKIFDPYFTTKSDSKGTGLGLYISKILINESMNGTLTVHNTEVGACFQISLIKVIL